MEGLKRTKNDIVVEQIKGVLKATSLGEVREMNLAEINEVLKVYMYLSFVRCWVCPCYQLKSFAH